MPPKAKFTREEITDAAFEILRKKGVQAVTARSLAQKLGSSPRPIFTVFKDMDELWMELIKNAKKVYSEYIKKGLSDPMPFKGVGTQYILFAIEEPMLFSLLFMKKSDKIPDFERVLPLIDDNYEEIFDSVKNGYNLDDDHAEMLYQHLWIYTHGIATLCATGMCVFSPQELDKKISEVFKSLLRSILEGKF